MSEQFILHRRDSRALWMWLAVGLCLCAVWLVWGTRPSPGSAGTGSRRVPVVRPHSNTLPMPPPSVARTQALSA
jgi:hypothetical protein